MSFYKFLFYELTPESLRLIFECRYFKLLGGPDARFHSIGKGEPADMFIKDGMLYSSRLFPIGWKVGEKVDLNVVPAFDYSDCMRMTDDNLEACLDILIKNSDKNIKKSV